MDPDPYSRWDNTWPQMLHNHLCPPAETRTAPHTRDEEALAVAELSRAHAKPHLTCGHYLLIFVLVVSLLVLLGFMFAHGL